MKASYYSKWDSIPETPRLVTRQHVADLLRASRSRRGKRNNWPLANGYWIRDAGLTLTREITGIISDKLANRATL